MEGLQRVIFIRFNPDGYTDSTGSTYPSLFQINELGIPEPTDHFEFVMDNLNPLVQSIIDGEVLDTSINQLAGYVFVNYNSTSNAIKLALDEFGDQNVVQFYF